MRYKIKPLDWRSTDAQNAAVAYTWPTSLNTYTVFLFDDEYQVTDRLATIWKVCQSVEEAKAVAESHHISLVEQLLIKESELPQDGTSYEHFFHKLK